MAAINIPISCVASEPTEEIEILHRELRQRGIGSQRLQTSHAFHSAMMDPVVEPLTALAKKLTLKAPRLPYVSGVSGTWITKEQALDPTYWSRHLRQTVRFSDGIEELLKEHERIL